MNALVPYGIAGNSSATVQVTTGGGNSAAVSLYLRPAQPEVFNSRGSALALNQDNTVNSAANPAAAGSTVAIFATGGGPVDPAPGDGVITTGTASLINGVTVRVGGQNATVSYAGGAPGEVAGLVQINVQLPAGVTGQVPVVIKIGDQVSQSTITVAIR